MRFRTALGIVLLTCTSATPALAGWSSPGDTLMDYYGGSGPWQLTPDGTGGLYAGVVYYQHGAISALRMFHVPADGTTPPAMNIGADDFDWVPDHVGGLFTEYRYQGSIRLAHYLPSDSADPSFPGLFYDPASGPGQAQLAGIASDDSGGVFVTAMIENAGVLAWRVIADGSPGGGWPTDGVSVRDVFGEGYFMDPVVADDGSGGMLLAIVPFNGSGYTIRLYRYLANGTRKWTTFANSPQP